MTKAGEEATPTDADVNTLTVGVFGTGWSMVYTAVSYTHLDVYKRQSIITLKIENPLLILCVIPCI